MTEEDVAGIAKGLMIIGVLCFVLSCGGCFACVSSLNTTYGPEEYYDKGGGKVGYGAKSYTSGGEGAGYYVGLPILAGIVLIIASSVVGSVGRRRVWAKTLTNLPLGELSHQLRGLERKKSGATAGFLGMSKEQQSAALSEANDAEARINILSRLIKERQTNQQRHPEPESTAGKSEED